MSDLSPSLAEMIRSMQDKILRLQQRNVRAEAGIITGEIRMYGGDTAPEGFLLCNGQAVSRDSFKLLFAAIGTRYGAGDGSTTFNLPPFNNANRFPRGSTGGGATGGASSHEHSMAHTHDFTTGQAGAPYLAGVAAGSDFVASLPDHVHTGTTDGSSAANTGSASNLPPFVDVRFIIKT